MRHWVGGLVLWRVVCLGGVAGGEAPKVLTVDEIVLRMMAKNEARQADLAGYSSERTYRVEYRGTGGERYAEILVRAEYVGAGQKLLTVVEQSGSKVICERVLRKMVESEQEVSEKANRAQMMLSPQNYKIALEGKDEVDGVPAWILSVSPKSESKFTYLGRVWVSMEDYAVIRVQGEPAKNPSWWLTRASFDWKYEKHGEFWLPEKSIAVSHVRIGGDAKLTIEYGAYQIVSTDKAVSELTTAEHSGDRASFR
jgi:hypothetical protein